MNRKYTYILEGLDCANCANKIENEVNKLDGYYNVVVNFSTSKLSFESSCNNVLEQVTKVVNKIEPDVLVLDKTVNSSFRINKLTLLRLCIGLFLGLSTLFVDYSNNADVLVILCSYLVLLPKTMVKAIKILIRNKSLDENMLITISVIGAFLIGDGFEGFMVIGLYEIGKLLEEMAVNKSKKSVSELMDIKVEYANLKVNGGLISKSPEDINIGDIIVVKKGEKVPLDGTVVKGNTYIDTSALTGESILQRVSVKDKVLSGSINTDSIIEIRVDETYENSAVHRILDLVEKATDRKAKTENFVAKAARVYTPIVLLLAILTGVLLPIISNVSYSDSIYRALSFLVISCPCAIAISVPLSYFSGIGLASKHGILIKGSDYLDNLRKISTIIFDKTGTLTTGVFEVSEIISLNDRYSKEELLEICAIGESFSNHPIAKSVIKYYGKKICNKNVQDYKEISGMGIEFKLNNLFVQIGNNSLIKKKKEQDGNYLNIMFNHELVGYMVIKDQIKSSTVKAIEKLKQSNKKVMVFTGDNGVVAKEVCSKLGIDNYYYNLLPDDKYQKLEKIIKEKNKNEVVAFVGDGINDAPVLMLSDIGISMGSIGSQSAIEASDIVLMKDDVDSINTALDISKRTTRIIKQNLIFAIGTKVLFIILNIFGTLAMAWAVFADVGVTLLAILNSIRILKMK